MAKEKMSTDDLNQVSGGASWEPEYDRTHNAKVKASGTCDNFSQKPGKGTERICKNCAYYMKYGGNLIREAYDYCSLLVGDE